MSQLIQLLIGRELARSKGIEEPADQFRIGAVAALMSQPMLGLVLANAMADRQAPVVRKAGTEQQESSDASAATGNTLPTPAGKSSRS